MLKKYETAARQNEQELMAFIALLRKENVKSYLEIGCKFGGSLWKIANSLPVGSRVVGVDLPGGDGSFKDSQPILIECVNALRGKGYDVHLMLGDSTAADIVRKVELLGPFDACFIDGNHATEYLTQDWKNYSRLSRLVAFHDINYSRADTSFKHAAKAPFQVPPFWNELKKTFRHHEIKFDKKDNGIGVLWR